MPPRKKLPVKRNAKSRVPPRSTASPSDNKETAVKKRKEDKEEPSNARAGSGDRPGKNKNSPSRKSTPAEGGTLSGKASEFHRKKRDLLSVVFVELALRSFQRLSRQDQGIGEDVSEMEE